VRNISELKEEAIIHERTIAQGSKQIVACILEMLKLNKVIKQRGSLAQWKGGASARAQPRNQFLPIQSNHRDIRQLTNLKLKDTSPAKKLDN